MKTRSILVRFPAYPYSIETLMPDAHLARVARCLIDGGHKTQVYDYATVETLDRLVPPELRGPAQRLADRFLGGPTPNRLATVARLREVRGTDRAFRACRESVCGDIAKELASKGHVDFVGFKLETGDALEAVLSIARRLREKRPSVRLIGVTSEGGLFCEALVDMTDVFDCVWGGDVEWTVAALAERINDPSGWGKIPGLFCKTGHRALKRALRRAPQGRGFVTDAPTLLPAPAYEPSVYPALRKASKLKLFVLEDSRGCGCACHRCPRPDGEVTSVRTKPPRALCAELVRLAWLHGARVVHFSGAGAHASHVYAVAREILSRRLDVSYSRAGHVGHIAPTSFAVLRVSGCEAVSFQVDTGSQRLLEDYYGRTFGVTQMERLLRSSKSSGTFTVARLAYPCAADDRHTRAETLRLLDRTMPHSAPVDLPKLMPGSVWYEEPGRFGFRTDPKRYVRHALFGRIPFPAVTRRWGALPYRVLGWSSAQLVRENEALAREIEERGIATLVSEKMALVARTLGYGGTELEFGERVERQFLAGDIAAIAEIVHRFNECACVPVNAVPFSTLAPIRAAVGN